jgi:hypothetical protein
VDEHLIVKNHDIEILKTNNHVHLITLKKLTVDLYGISICKK